MYAYTAASTTRTGIIVHVRVQRGAMPSRMSLRESTTTILVKDVGYRM